MCPQEFFLLFDFHRPRDPEQDYAGRLTDRDCEQLYAALDN